MTTRQIQNLLREQWDLSFSLGAISQAQCPVSGWLQPIYAQMGEAVRQAPGAHADETTHYRGGERRWLWTFCTASVVYFLVHYSRGKGAANELREGFEGVLITDRHGGYKATILRTAASCAGRISSATWNASPGDAVPPALWANSR